ncbi:MAG: D-2-hydroxyacid dehydrogenase [Gemmatimonadota bacterium]|jgi:phosphoglycerate dehydrogenase-like enzyme
MVLDMDDRRPVYALPDGVPDRIRAVLPDEWSLTVVDALSDGSGDGSGRATAEALAAVADAEVYLGLGIPAAILDAGPQLRWVHTGTAGVGSWLTPQMRQRDILFTNSAGVFGPAMAETVLAFLLHFARGLHVARRVQQAGTWDKTAFDGPEQPFRELGRSTVGIVGLGGVGREVARRCAALGARVLGLRRRAGTVDGVEVVRGPDGLQRILRESDYVVVTAPETAETAGMLDAAAFAHMQAHAVVVNVGRGRIMDEDALVAALREGAIGGAALDVFATEPLPDGHPLWTAPNVLLTPHVSAYTGHFWEREAELIMENVRRYLAGQALLNVVDKSAGY